MTGPTEIACTGKQRVLGQLRRGQAHEGTALAQAKGREHDPLRLQAAHDALEQHRGRAYGLGPPPGHAWDRLQLVIVQGGDTAAERDRLVGGQPVVMQDLQRRVGHGQADPCQSAPAATDHIEVAAGSGTREPWHAGQTFIDDACRWHIAVEQHSRDRQCADRQAAIGCARAFGRHDGEIDAAATQVADHPVRTVEAVGDSHRGRACLVPAGQDHDRAAGGALGLRQEVLSVLGTADGLGRHVLDLACPQCLGDVGEPPQRVQGAVHLPAAQLSGSRQPLPRAQTDFSLNRAMGARHSRS